MLSNRNLLRNIGKDNVLKAVSLPNISLEAEEADAFIDIIEDESVLFKNANFIRMAKNTKNLRHIGISDRILYAGTLGPSEYLTTLDENNIQLSATELVGVIPIKDVDLEDLPEGNRYFDHVMELCAKKISNELEEVALIGDTSTASGFGAKDARKQIDGWFRQLDNSQSGETYENDVTGSTTMLDFSNTINGGNYGDHTSDFQMAGNIAEMNSTTGYWEFKMGKMLMQMPTAYFKKFSLGQFRYFMPPRVEAVHVSALEARATALGDAAIIGGQQMRYRNVPMVSVPGIPLTMEAYTSDITKDNFDATNGTYAFVMLTMPENLAVGMQRALKVELQRDAINRQTYIVYTIRFDAKVEDVAAVVLGKRVVYDAVFSQ
jgi:hypothetical protein